MIDVQEVRPEDVGEHGMCCACDCGCERCFEVGDTYLSKLVGMVEEIPLCEVVCLGCAEHP